MPELRRIPIDLDVHRAIERERQSFLESESDILRRLLLSPDRESCSLIRKAGRRRPSLRSKVARSRGLWSVEVHGERIPATNMKDAYRTLLVELDRRYPGFLDRFAREGSGRRRFVARTPEALYTSSPHLASEHARHLTGDWHFDSNLSTEQVARRARIAARVAGLTYGRDVHLRDNLREI